MQRHVSKGAIESINVVECSYVCSYDTSLFVVLWVFENYVIMVNLVMFQYWVASVNVNMGMQLAQLVYRYLGPGVGL